MMMMTMVLIFRECLSERFRLTKQRLSSVRGPVFFKLWPQLQVENLNHRLLNKTTIAFSTHVSALEQKANHDLFRC